MVEVNDNCLINNMTYEGYEISAQNDIILVFYGPGGNLTNHINPAYPFCLLIFTDIHE
jgi:hypothetical protein